VYARSYMSAPGDDTFDDDRSSGDAANSLDPLATTSAPSHPRADDTTSDGKYLPANLSDGHLGDYLIERKLGAGGMGEVFAARHIETGERVALKLLEQARATGLYRFKREFRALAGVDHENLVRLGELVVLPDQRAFFTMELVDGVPFDEYVRQGAAPGELPNISRLTRALRQLVAGVDALHRNRCLHRDLKPSNVLVNAAGRVVILDFGLVGDLDGRNERTHGPTHSGQMLGTPSYMAPEQAAGRSVGLGADSYAVGVILYECLTGTRPFEGSLYEVLNRKLEGEVPDPSTRVGTDIPPPLHELCLSLLQRDPSARPSVADVLARLGDELVPSSRRVRTEHLFVGRSDELAALDHAWQEVAGGVTMTMHLSGKSGLGKSALFAHFLADLRTRAQALILRGRCYEAESVPFKGIDGVIDSLALHLHHLPALVRARLQPRRFEALVRLFPVLDGMWTGGLPWSERAEPAEMRRQARRALRELLERLADERPLVLAIDDFQWADLDSVELLHALTEAPDPPRMLVLVAFRPVANTVLDELRKTAAEPGQVTRVLELGPLPEADAQAFAAALLRDDVHAGGSIEERARTYASRAAGNPFFISQLVFSQDALSSSSSVDRVVARRIRALSAGARVLLSTIAVAARPIPLNVALAAAGTEAHEADVAELRELELIRLTGARTSDPVEAAHDRIREVAVSELEPELLTSTHLALAHAYEAEGMGAAELLAEHYERGGDRVAALPNLERAAEQAAASFANQRALALYRHGLTLVPERDERARARLERGIAEQLAILGYCGEAATCFAALARTANSEAERLRLESHSIENRLSNGEIKAGLAQLREALQPLGIPLPRSKLALIARLIREQIASRLSGTSNKLPATEHELAKLDLILAGVQGLQQYEALHFGYLTYTLLRHARAAGSAYHLSGALVLAATVDACQGNKQRTLALLEELEQLRPHWGHIPELRQRFEYGKMMVQHWMLDLDWQQANEQFRQLCYDDPRNVDTGQTIRIMMTWATNLLYSGSFAQGREIFKAAWFLAHGRGTQHELVNQMAMKAMTDVLRGEDADADELMEAYESAASNENYDFSHFLHDYVLASIDLYRGDGPLAFSRSERIVVNARRNFLDANPLARWASQDLKGRCALAELVRAPDSRHARAGLRRALRSLRRMIPRWPAQGFVASLQAGLHSVRGEFDEAVSCWREAHRHHQATHSRAHDAATCLRLAQFTAAPEREQFQALADAYFVAEHIHDPARFAAVYAPARLDAG
jgi:hypothetical protein